MWPCLTVDKGYVCGTNDGLALSDRLISGTVERSAGDLFGAVESVVFVSFCSSAMPISFPLGVAFARSLCGVSLF